MSTIWTKKRKRRKRLILEELNSRKTLISRTVSKETTTIPKRNSGHLVGCVRRIVNFKP